MRISLHELVMCRIMYPICQIVSPNNLAQHDCVVRRSCWTSATRWACLTPSPRWRWPPACASCTAWSSWTHPSHPISLSPSLQVGSFSTTCMPRGPCVLYLRNVFAF